MASNRARQWSWPLASAPGSEGSAILPSPALDADKNGRFLANFSTSLSENCFGEGDSPILLRRLRKIGTVPAVLGWALCPFSRRPFSALRRFALRRRPDGGA